MKKAALVHAHACESSKERIVFDRSVASLFAAGGLVSFRCDAIEIDAPEGRAHLPQLPVSLPSRGAGALEFREKSPMWNLSS